VVVRAPGRVGRCWGTCPDLAGPYPRSVENPSFRRGLKGFSPAAITVIVGVVPDGPNGVLRAQGRPGGASGILAGLLWTHRRSVEIPTSGHGALDPSA